MGSTIIHTTFTLPLTSNHMFAMRYICSPVIGPIKWEAFFVSKNCTLPWITNCDLIRNLLKPAFLVLTRQNNFRFCPGISVAVCLKMSLNAFCRHLQITRSLDFCCFHLSLLFLYCATCRLILNFSKLLIFFFGPRLAFKILRSNNNTVV